MATQVVKYFMLAQNRCQSLQSWKGAKSKCLETLRAFDFFWSAQKPGGRNPDRQLNNWMKWLNCYQTTVFKFEPFLFSSGFIQFLPPANNPQAQRDCVPPTTWVKGLSSKHKFKWLLSMQPFCCPTILKRTIISQTFILDLLKINILGKSKRYFPKWWFDADLPWCKIKIPLKQLQVILGFHAQFRWKISANA